MAALVGGFSAGMFRLGLEINKANLSGFLYDFADLNFLYFAIFSFLACIALMITVSLITPAPDLNRISGLTYATTSKNDLKESKNSWESFDLINSVIIILILALILIYFSPIGIGG